MKIEINTFDNLIDVLNNYDLNKEQRNELVRLALHLIVMKDYTKDELIHELKLMWGKYHDKVERPIFLGVDLT